MMATSDALLPPAAGIAAAVSTLAGTFFIEGGAALPFFGVGISTLGMAVAGSLLAFSYGTPVKGTWRLIGYAVGGVFLGVWGVHLLPAALDWDWYYELGEEVAQPPVAGVVALVSRWAIPLVVEQLPAVWKRVFNSGGSPGPGER